VATSNINNELKALLARIESVDENPIYSEVRDDSKLRK